MKTSLVAAAALLTVSVVSADTMLDAADFGIAPGKAFTAADVTRLTQAAAVAEKPAVIRFAPGTYILGAEQCQTREWFISNHDQANPRTVFLPLEGLRDVTVDGSGARFELNGRFMFAGIWDCTNVTLQGCTVDAVTPQLTQLRFLAVDPQAKTVTFRPEGSAAVTLEGTRLILSGPGFRYAPGGGILFEPDGSIAYRSGDCGMNLGNVILQEDGTYLARDCANAAYRPFQRMALRCWERPAPGIVISDSKDTALLNVTIHYADGMGVIAQSSETITLDGLRVIPDRAKGRFFSTQADATHFSGCWGTIRSVNGIYEGMMDDAINVHGTYLQVEKRIDERTVEAAYMHVQAYGMTWGDPGDEVAFVRALTLDTEPTLGRIASIVSLDKPDVRQGAKRFRITFADPLPPDVDPSKDIFGLENVKRTPEVYFEGNRVAFNRARGALFSSPRKTVCRGNVFDRVSGCAVLLCGDCRGWFESGPCRDVLIADNQFIDVLTSPFQFTEAVISITPVISQPDRQKQAFHSGIVIENNDFVAFDRPLIFAESVDGLTVRNNTYTKSDAYAPYHWQTQWLTLRRCINVRADRPVGLPADVR